MVISSLKKKEKISYYDCMVNTDLLKVGIRLAAQTCEINFFTKSLSLKSALYQAQAQTCEINFFTKSLPLKSAL
jgi:hypothetical protein